MKYNSIDSERAVVGGLLLEPSVDKILLTRLTPEDFSDDKLSYIFTSILEMVKKKISVDAVTVRDYIDLERQPNDRPWAVNFEDLALLLENSIGSTNIQSYARHIRECRIKNAVEDLKKDIDYENYQETVSQIQNLELELEDKDESSIKAIVGKTVDSSILCVPFCMFV